MRNVLIILHRQVGDVLLATPMASHLKAHHPTDKVYWVAHPMAKAVLDGLPGVEAVFYLPQPPNAKKKTVKYVLNYIHYLLLDIAFLWKLYSFQFTAVVDAMCNPRSALQTWVTRAPLRVGFKTRRPRNWAYTCLIPREKLSQYLGWSRLHLLEPLQCPLPSKTTAYLPRLPIREGHYSTIDNFMKTHQLKSKTYVLLSPCGRRSNRWWPHGSFQELAFRLITEVGLHVVWLWGPGEKEEVCAIHKNLEEQLKAFKNRSPTVYKSIFPENLWNLNEVAAACSHAAAWAGVSNGLAKCALAVKCPTVEIHGPTRPEPWTFPDIALHRSVQRHEGCVNCEKNYCVKPIRECLELLTVDDVLKPLLNLWKHNVSPEPHHV